MRQALVSTAVLFAVGMAWAALSEPATAQDGQPPVISAAPAGDAPVAAAADGPQLKLPIERREAPDSFGAWVERFSPILILLVVIVFVLVRLPRVELGHSDAFRRRPGAEIDPATGQRADLDPANWVIWPVAMVPLALIGLLLATRIWSSKPQPKGASGH